MLYAVRTAPNLSPVTISYKQAKILAWFSVRECFDKAGWLAKRWVWKWK